jgi:hypothetical protein
MDVQYSFLNQHPHFVRSTIVMGQLLPVGVFVVLAVQKGERGKG